MMITLFTSLYYYNCQKIDNKKSMPLSYPLRYIKQTTVHYIRAFHAHQQCRVCHNVRRMPRCRSSSLFLLFSLNATQHFVFFALQPDIPYSGHCYYQPKPTFRNPGRQSASDDHFRLSRFSFSWQAPGMKQSSVWSFLWGLVCRIPGRTFPRHAFSYDN